MRLSRATLVGLAWAAFLGAGAVLCLPDVEARPRPRAGDRQDLWRGAYTYDWDAGDAGVADVDSGASDSGAADVDGGADAGTPDTGADTGVDAGVDTGVPDAGPDAGHDDSGQLVEELYVEFAQSLGMGATGDAGVTLSCFDAGCYSLRRLTGDGGLVLFSEDGGYRNEFNNASAPWVEAPGAPMMAQLRLMGVVYPNAIYTIGAQQGAPYSQLKYNGNGIEQAADAGVNDGGAGYIFDAVERNVLNLCNATPTQKYRVMAALINQGEGDIRFGHSEEYAGFMASLKADINTRLRALPCIVDQDIPLHQRQVNSASAYESEYNTLAYAQALAQDAGITVGAPTYPLTPLPLQHLINTSYRTMAETRATELQRIQLGTYAALYPNSLVASSDKIVITYGGCTSPMVLDTTTISTTGLDTHGFRLYEAGGRTISSVAVGSEPCTIEITLSGAVYAGTHVSYAYECPSATGDAGIVTDTGAIVGNCGGSAMGPVVGMRGTARDSYCVGAWHGTLDAGLDAGPPDVDSGVECLHNWALVHGPLAVTGGADYAPLENSASASLDGTGDYFSAADTANFNATSHLTVCAWVKATSFGSGLGIASKSANGACGWGVTLSSGGLLGFTTCATSGGDGTIRDFSTTALSLNTATHVCVVYDGTQGTETNRVATYINGSADAIGTTAGTTPTTLIVTAASVRVGRFQDGNDGSTDLTGWRSFQGTLDNVMIWFGESLSSAEVASIYASGTAVNPYASAHSSGDWPETSPGAWLRLFDRSYITRNGIFLGTREGYLGRCRGTYSNTPGAGTSEAGLCVGGLVAGDLIPLEALYLDSGAIHNFGSETSSRFTRNGNPFPTAAIP